MKRRPRLTTPYGRTLLICALIVLGYLLGSSRVFAYHFFYAGSGGGMSAARWTTLPVNLVVENNPASFPADLQFAVDTWNNVTTAKNVLGSVSQTAASFTGSNFRSTWGNMPSGGDGQHEVVFDADGSALAAAGRNPEITLGYGPSRIEVVGGQAVIVDSFLIINGSRTDFDVRAVMVHELGHVQGLAHSSVGMHHTDSKPGAALDVISVFSLPTMHPFALDGTSLRSLEPDDDAALSELYPEPSFATSTARIEGTVKRCGNDNAVTGANVRAVNTSDASIQLSRFTGFDGNGDGRFVIRGLPPGSYKLIVEPMGANTFNIATRFGTPPTKQEMDFETEYHNPPAEDDCTEELPDTPSNIAVAAGGAASGKNFKVSGARLAFVVDDTGSMGNEIGAVRTILSRFVSTMDTLNRTIGTPFPTTTIVTFKDNVTRRVTSDDAARLQEVIGSLSASGGGDCPESSNAALITAGRLLRNGGVVMLFTDANSRADGPTRGEVSQLYRSKSLKLFTLLSGTCDAGGVSTLKPSAAGSSCEPMCAGGSTNLHEFPPPDTLGNENAVRTFSEISAETGGIFTAIPGIKANILVETERYINSGTNMAVSSAVPAVGLVTPGDGPQGSTLHVEIRGSNTNFQSSSTVTFSGTGVTVNSFVVNSPERITANVTVQPGAALGFRDVRVRTTLGSGSVETAEGVGAFNIIAPPVNPTVLGVSPPQAPRGHTLNVAISAAGTHFVAGSSVADFGPGVTVNSTTVVNSTSAVANITVDSDAPIGFRDVSVTTGSEFADEDVVGPFLVTAPPPAIPRLASISPASGARGTTLNVLLTGENVNFVNGVSAASFSGAGITVNRTDVLSPSTARLSVTIAPGAALGFRDVFVATGSEVAAILRAFQVTVLSSVQLQATGLTVSEGVNSINLSVTRTGNTAAAATVRYATSNGTARETSDYTPAQGTLRFAAGETSKRITILVTDDGFAEGSETLNVTLSNPTGTEVGSPGSVTLTITDNDASTVAINPLSNARFFVRRHYHDFFNRDPDASGDQAGLNFWVGQLAVCDSITNPQAKGACLEERRINVSVAFFLSIEFQKTGYFVFRFYRASFPSSAQRPRGLPRFKEFLNDLQEVGRGVVVGQGNWEQVLENNRQQFARAWVQRADFLLLHPASLTGQQYVNALFANSGVTPSSAERAAALTAFGSGGVEGRARALRSVVEARSVYNRQYNPAFVLMQYFGYLRRNPNDAPEPGLSFAGYDFWLNKLNQFSLPNEDVSDERVALNRAKRAEMVKSFLVSSEYMSRFGPNNFDLRR